MDPDRDPDRDLPVGDHASTEDAVSRVPEVDTAAYVAAVDSARAAQPRRRGSRALPIFLSAALAFLAGVALEKQVVERSAAEDPSPPPATGASVTGNQDAESAPGDALVVGQVKFVDGATLYVTDRRGEVTKVTTTDGSTFATATPGTISALRPGDVVIVDGERQSDGTLSATRVFGTGPG